MPLQPVNLNHDQLSSILTDIAESFKSGDSFEGNIEYLMDDHNGWLVRGTYRIGNLQGQGGMRVIGEIERENPTGN